MLTMRLLAEMLRRHTVTPATDEGAAQVALAPHMDFTLGSVYATVVIDMYLAGVFTMMVLRYWNTQFKKRDLWVLHGVVVAMMVMTYSVTSLNIYYVWSLLVDGFGEFSQFFHIQKASGVFPLIDGVTALIAQSFFAYRAFRLNNNNWFILVALSVTMLGSVGAATASTVLWLGLSSMMEFNKVYIPGVVWLVATMFTNTIITASILWGLHKSNKAWDYANSLVPRITFITFESQMLPLCIAFAFMIQYSIEYTSYVGTTFLGITSKFYGIGLLFSLNWRTNEAKAEGDVFTNAATGRSFRLPGDGVTAIQVDVETETYEMRAQPMGKDNYHTPGLEKIEDVEWESDCKTDVPASSIKSSTTQNTRVRLIAPTPKDSGSLRTATPPAMPEAQ